jgi:hypothetical protein
MRSRLTESLSKRFELLYPGTRAVVACLDRGLRLPPFRVVSYLVVNVPKLHTLRAKVPCPAYRRSL